MAGKPPLPPAGFDQLSVEDQVAYVQGLWDHIAARPEKVPVPEWHRQLINERLAGYDADSAPGRPWEEVQEDLRSKLAERKPEGR